MIDVVLLRFSSPPFIREMLLAQMLVDCATSSVHSRLRFSLRDLLPRPRSGKRGLSDPAGQRGLGVPRVMGEVLASFLKMTMSAGL